MYILNLNVLTNFFGNCSALSIYSNNLVFFVRSDMVYLVSLRASPHGSISISFNVSVKFVLALTTITRAANPTSLTK